MSTLHTSLILLKFLLCIIQCLFSSTNHQSHITMTYNIWRNRLTRIAISKILSRIGIFLIIIISHSNITAAKTIILHIHSFWVTLIIFKKIIVTKKNTKMIVLIRITISITVITMRSMIALSNNKLTILSNNQFKLS